MAVSPEVTITHTSILSILPSPCSHQHILFSSSTVKMYKCETCGASFEDQATYEKHMDDKVHRPECETCRRTFGTWSACDQHMDDTDHWAPRYDCQTCSREFFSQSAADQHMTAVGHWSPRVPCETCNMTFPNKLIANLHMTAMSHFKNYCRPCGRRFQSEHSLQIITAFHLIASGSLEHGPQR